MALAEPNLAVQRMPDIERSGRRGRRDQPTFLGGLDRPMISQRLQKHSVDGLRDRNQIDDVANVVGHPANLHLDDLDERAGAKFAATDLICELEGIIARANTLSDALNAYGYPVSDAHWKNASGSMSIQARGLHLAAANYREARDAALSQHHGGTDGV